VDLVVEETKLENNKDKMEREWWECPDGLGIHTLLSFIENTKNGAAEHHLVEVERQERLDAPDSKKPALAMHDTDSTISIMEDRLGAVAIKLGSLDEDDDYFSTEDLKLRVDAVKETIEISKKLTMALQSQLQWFETRRRIAEKNDVFLDTRKKLNIAGNDLENVDNELVLVTRDYNQAKSVWQRDWVKLSSTLANPVEKGLVKPSTPQPQQIHQQLEQSSHSQAQRQCGKNIYHC
jgi:hypothetical protein